MAQEFSYDDLFELFSHLSKYIKYPWLKIKTVIRAQTEYCQRCRHRSHWTSAIAYAIVILGFLLPLGVNCIIEICTESGSFTTLKTHTQHELAKNMSCIETSRTVTVQVNSLGLLHMFFEAEIKTTLNILTEIIFIHKCYSSQGCR